MKYEVILFDVDDTLFDFGMTEKEALHKTFQTYGISTPQVEYLPIYKEISGGLWKELEQGRTTLPELGEQRFTRLFRALGLSIDGAAFNRDYLSNLGKEVHLTEGAVELCSQLTGYRLVIITNGFDAVQKARIGGSPLCNSFECLVTSEEAGFQKPDKGIFDYVFTQLQMTDKSKLLIVGDSLTSDIQGGINYGIDTCWFNPLRKENKLGIQPTYEIHALMELLDHL
ncbi:YjjG family noncanonical pyrimidine nucleotidase [Brevibacillus choshinensis]|uniref:YjjG family noncanonical pyrimidine nucleotidase n=1 Tax=Brevibacillus choshinensis TaxID=54911 RepID=A0ABX7FWD7_BRECH|nr:YjjG family noncanonical pyrimidine nucleotidase [Brevibacillus choshinensis]QRG70178.1 YjjG family noncanonical pyrimidine nucleotidase [Brevibacillus choshinensis]